MMSISAAVRHVAFAGAIAIGMVSAAWSQGNEFPSKPIRITVPYPPGNTVDAVARTVADQLSRELGQTVIVDNRPGAAGSIGAEFVAKSPADGYSLLMGDAGPLAIAPALRNDLPYDSTKDFVPVSLLGTSNFFVFVDGRLGVDTFEGLVALAKARPGQLKFGSSGIGSIAHLIQGTIALQTGMKLIHVPYRSASQTGPALLNGEVDMMTSGPTWPGVLDALAEGRVKIVAVTAAQRDFKYKDVPTLLEKGYPGLAFDSAGDATIYAPGKTPTAIVAKLGQAFERVTSKPEVAEFFTKSNFRPKGIYGAELSTRFGDDILMYKKIVGQLGKDVQQQ